MDGKTVFAGTLLILLLLSTLGAQLTTPAAATPSPAPPTTLCVYPSTATVAVNEKFTVKVRIENVSNLRGYEGGLSWNASVLNCTAFRYGNVWTPANRLDVSGDTDFSDGVIDPVWGTTGKTTIVGPANGTLFEADFTAKATGIFNVHLKGVTLVDYMLNSIPVSAVDVFTVVWGQDAYSVVTVSNLTSLWLRNHAFNQSAREISFEIAGGSTGFCNVTIPKALLDTPAFLPGNWTVQVDRKNVTHTPAENATHTSLYFICDPNQRVRIRGTWAIGDPRPDVAVTSVIPYPTKVWANETVSVTVVVTNEGSGNQTFGVTAYYGNNSIGTRNVTELSPGANATLIFPWNTTGVAQGVYVIRAEASRVPWEAEADTRDNNLTDGTVTIGRPAPDVAVTSVVPSRNEVVVGESVNVTVGVRNEGNVNLTFNVTAYYDNNPIGKQTVTDLPPGNATTLTFPWNTTGVALGVYTMKAAAEVVQEEDDVKDNNRTAVDTVRVMFIRRVPSSEYRTIQAAVDAANPGDTIRVASGTYYEHLVVGKPVELVGESRDTTIIDANGTDHVIYVTAGHVEIREFTIRKGMMDGVMRYGVWLYRSSGSIVSHNRLSSNYMGIVLEDGSDGNLISDNTITDNSVGILIHTSRGNTISGNTVASNSLGIELFGSTTELNTIYHNNFVGNTQQVWLQGTLGVNFWDNGRGVVPGEGNYWSDYRGRDRNGDGIGDWGVLPHQGVDNYPLIEPWSPLRAFSVIWREVTYCVTILSNSTIASFSFRYPPKQIGFNATGPSGMVGFCNVTVPRGLIGGGFTVLVDEAPPPAGYTLTQNATHTSLYFTFSYHGTRHIKLLSPELLPVLIEANSEFTAENGVTGGNGTADYPYVIGPPDYPYVMEGWHIDGAGGHCVRIRNTDAHFIVTGLRLHDGSSGVFLENVTNGGVHNCTVADNTRGIFLLGSGNTTLRGNNMTGNAYNLGVEGDTLPDFINEIDASNVVDGKPVCYWVNQRGGQVPLDAGFVGVVNSTGVTVRDLTLENCDPGVLLAYTNDSRIENVTVSHNDRGIRLINSFNNVVTGNNATSNSEGIRLDNSSLNTIAGNDVALNNLCGVHLQSSLRNTLSNNSVTSNQEDGILIGSSSGNNTVSGNTVSGNGAGISLDPSSGGNTLYHNNLADNVVQAVDNATNTWDNGAEGNYWSDYQGKDANGDGIGDTPYSVDGDTSDIYPLVEPWSPLRVFNVFWEGKTYRVTVLSGSTVAGFGFQPLMQACFNVTGPPGSTGFCNVTIPNPLFSGIFAVWVDSASVQYTWTRNATHTSLYFTFKHSTHRNTVFDVFGPPRVSWYKRQGEPGYDERADLNRDGLVDITDLGKLGRDWRDIYGVP